MENFRFHLTVSSSVLTAVNNKGKVKAHCSKGWGFCLRKEKQFSELPGCIWRTAICTPLLMNSTLLFRL